MKHFVDYVESGRPIVAMRTATHAFDLKTSKTYQRYSWNNKEWDGGFGRQILGETWIAHHGKHAVQSTRGIIAPGQESHPILRGIRSGEIWVPTDVYQVRLPLPGDAQPLILGQVLEGMNATDAPVAGKQNDPMMPVAWVKTGLAARVHDDHGLGAGPAERAVPAAAGERLLLGAQDGEPDRPAVERGTGRDLHSAALQVRRTCAGAEALRPEAMNRGRARQWSRTAFALAALFASFPIAGRLLLGEWTFEGATGLAGLWLAIGVYLHIRSRRMKGDPDPRRYSTKRCNSSRRANPTAPSRCSTVRFRRSPRFWQAYQYRGEARLQFGKVSAALADIDEAIRLAPRGTAAIRLRSRAESLLREI